MVLSVLLACAHRADTAPPDADTAVPGDTAEAADTADTAGLEGGTGLLTRVGQATVGSSYNGTEEIRFAPTAGDAQALCSVVVPVTAAGARSDCADCLWAFDVVLGAPTVSIDTACEAAGYNAQAIAALEGSVRGYGFADEYLGHAEALLVLQDGAWEPVSFADWSAETGLLSYEWEQGYLPYGPR